MSNARLVSDCTSGGGLSKSAYAAAFSYAPTGAIEQMTLGNGLVESASYNNRLQPVSMGLGVSATNPSTWSAGYGYGTANNGNLQSQTVAAAGNTFSQSYTYDGLNRLKTAQETNGWNQAYVYDTFGNRALIMGTSYYIPGGTWTPQVTADDPSQVAALFPNNRQTALTYDAAGNVQILPGNTTFTYDAENRQTSATMGGITTTYAYDADGRRVQKLQGGTATTYYYDGAGQLGAEYATAVAPGLCTTCYLTADHLGSTRAMTDQNGTVQALHDYLPFGEELPAGINTRGALYGSDEPNQKFTAKERDSETGLDYFGARYFSGAQGRFTTPDKPFADQHPEDPQSWNLYTYGRNNPLRFVDLEGGAVFESAAKLTEVGNRVMKLSQLQPVYLGNIGGRDRWETYCNFGVQKILQAGDDKTLNGKTASEITAYLSNEDNATQLSNEDAVAYAKEGVTVIAAELGHVAVVAPEDMVKAGTGWQKATGQKEVPKVLNVGKKNETLPVNYAFDSSRPPKLYILNADKKKIEERRKAKKSQSTPEKKEDEQ